MTDAEEVIDTALRIADEDIQSLVESTGLKDSPGVYVLDDDALQDDLVAEAIDYLVARGKAQVHAFVGGVVVTILGEAGGIGA
jgi:hypothetical protein